MLIFYVIFLPPTFYCREYPLRYYVLNPTIHLRLAIFDAPDCPTLRKYAAFN